MASVVLGLSLLVVACSTPAPSLKASIVTFEVNDGSRYKILVTDQASLATVTALLAHGDVPSIPDGRIVHETGVNTGWSWSIDPADLHFIAETDETCDGTPAEIEAGTFDSDRFCPWSATVVEMVPAP